MQSNRRRKVVAKTRILLPSKQVACLDGIRSEVSCSKCLGVMDKTHRLECGHCFCSKCIRPLEKKGQKCPICEKRITKDSITSDPLFSTLASKLKEIEQLSGYDRVPPSLQSKVTEVVSEKRSTSGSYELKQGVLIQSPISSPMKSCKKSAPSNQSPSKTINLCGGRSLEIVSDSSNDAFTYLCTHPEAQASIHLPVHMLTKTHKSPSIFADISLEDKQKEQEVSIQCSQEATEKVKTSSEECLMKPSTVTKIELPISQLTRCGDFVISDYIVVTSSLSSSNMDRIRTFASRVSVLWMQDFPHPTSLVDAANPDTHSTIAITMNQDNQRRKGRRRQEQKYILVIRATDNWCKRTVKYLYGLAYGAWIVTMDWIEDNLSSDSLIPPNAYEVKGDMKSNVLNAPRLSRLAHEKGQPGIFSGVFFFLRVQDTGNSIPLNILIDLMQRCGCVRDMGDMNSRGRSMRVVEVVERLTSKSGMDVVTVDWVLRCIGGWKIL